MIGSGIFIFVLAQMASPHSRKVLETTVLAAGSVGALLYVATEVVRLRVFHDYGAVSETTEFFLNVNVAASFFLISIFLALHLYEFSKTVFWMTWTPNVFAFAFTGSVAGTLGLSLGLLYLALQDETYQQAVFRHFSVLKTTWKPRICKGKMAAIFGVVIFGFLLFKMPALLGRHAIQDRQRWWGQAAEILWNHPVWGGGPGSFEKIAPLYKMPGIQSLYVHNFFLQTASEWGLPASFFLLLFFLEGIRKIRNPFLASGLIALLIHGLFDISLNIPGIFILFFFLLGIGTSVGQENRVSCSKNQSTFLAVTAAALCGILVWFWGIKPVAALSESLNAEEAFDKMDFGSAEMHLKKALVWDGLPAKYYSDLSKVILAQSLKDPNPQGRVRDAIPFQREALLREPGLTEYRSQMEEILSLSGLKKTPQ